MATDRIRQYPTTVLDTASGPLAENKYRETGKDVPFGSVSEIVSRRQCLFVDRNRNGFSVHNNQFVGFEVICGAPKTPRLKDRRR